MTADELVEFINREHARLITGAMLVTGTEAERLVAQVYADITMRRTAAWEGGDD